MPKTKLILVQFLLVFSIGLSAQENNHKVANSIIRNMVVYQSLNDFSTTVPVFFMVPGWFLFGSIEILHIPVFVDEAYYSNVDANNRKKVLHKELFDVVNVDFIPEIPNDKQLEVRVMDRGRLLYRLRFINHGDTLELIQASGLNNDEKRFSIFEGNLIGINQYSKGNYSMQRTELFGDSLRVQTDWSGKNNRTQKTEIRYQGLNPKTIKSFTANNEGQFKLKKTETYSYLDGMLKSVETTNRKGRQINLTSFVYSLDGDLLLLRKQKYDAPLLSIEFRYNDDGFPERKNVATSKRTYSVKYNYKSNNIDDITISNLFNNQSNIFNFEINLDQKLSRIEYRRVSVSSPPRHDTESILMGYGENGNIESIRVLDRRGRISKDIKFEYDYFSL
jgi:hypothetical protein